MDTPANNDNREGEEEVAVVVETSVGATVFGRPMWPHALYDFVHAVNRDVWVRERLGVANYKTVGVPEGSSAAAFVRDVLAGIKDS